MRLWAHEKEVRESISSRRVNELFLPGQPSRNRSRPPAALQEALDGAEIVVSVMPSQHCRRSVPADVPASHARDALRQRYQRVWKNDTPAHDRSDRASHRVADEGFAPRVGALSGPSFAKEVARGDPTAITIASQDAELAETVQQEFSDPRFRVYTNNDVVGVELGGALKNIIAIAAGVCDGLGLGHNSIAALITRGLAEMTRLVVACGGRPETMAGLAGLGDLVLTCTGGLSRNRSVGVELGRGRKLPEIIAGMHGMVAEGVFTTQPPSDWLARAASRCRSPSRWMPSCIATNLPRSHPRSDDPQREEREES